ncbi:hypothetical protein IMZ48_48895 [Candidatus Bathyarchaeota archaeon]|nr:hypothetical protein [Candidatus Bathyarchaeota archaeon]
MMSSATLWARPMIGTKSIIPLLLTSAMASILVQHKRQRACPPDNAMAGKRSYPRFFCMVLCTSSFVSPSMPHFVCLIMAISRVPRSWEDITMLRSASTAEPPA